MQMLLTTYKQTLDWINSLERFGVVPGLERMHFLLRQLDNPERNLKFIHVAGTNGKGSTCAFIANVLAQSGYGTGMFTSPNIGKFTNRIQFNGEDIEEHDLVNLSNQIRPIVNQMSATTIGSPTMFEVLTTIAILYFSKIRTTDFVVWETGMGGRLDCTNVVTPIVTVITNIGHDHLGVLGTTLEEVASEKAGIVKSYVPLITAAEQPSVLHVLLDVAQKQCSQVFVLNQHFSCQASATCLNSQSFNFLGPYGAIENISISMNGQHQITNAAVAIMVLEILRNLYGYKVDHNHIVAGLKGTFWHGRLEMIMNNPRILLDGAHNPEGAETLAAALKNLYSYRKLNMVVGMLRAKEHIPFLQHLIPLTDTLIITEPEFNGTMSSTELHQKVMQVVKEMDSTINILIEPVWLDAYKKLFTITGEEDLGVVTGTLYLIADVRSWIVHGVKSEKGR